MNRVHGRRPGRLGHVVATGIQIAIVEGKLAPGDPEPDPVAGAMKTGLPMLSRYRARRIPLTTFHERPAESTSISLAAKSVSFASEDTSSTAVTVPATATGLASGALV